MLHAGSIMFDVGCLMLNLKMMSEDEAAIQLLIGTGTTPGARNMITTTIASVQAGIMTNRPLQVWLLLYPCISVLMVVSSQPPPAAASCHLILSPGSAC